MTTMRTTTSNQGSVTVSSRAGRLLFALLLSSTIEDSLSMLANVPRRLVPACADELALALEQEQSPDPESAVGAEEDTSKSSITHIGSKVPSPTYLAAEPVEPEDAIAEACRKADETGDPKAQALAVVAAWRFFFPKLANHEEIARKQDLSSRKAREWIEEVSKAFAGQEATTVFGWMSGVDETKLLSMQFPLAWVNKMVVNKTKESQQSGGGAEVMDGWRQYARKVIEQGGSNHGVQDREGNLLRIARRVKSSPEEPS